MLKVKNLSYYKNYQKIFSNVNFEVALGEALVITGENGSGKTTLLKILAGICKSNDEAKILWNDFNVEDFRDEFNQDLQYLGHKNALKLDLTVKENLEFYAKISGTEILVDSAIKFFELEKLSDFAVKKLSAGWQKKVALARLLSCPATIWLLDEPSSNLDFAAKEKLFGLVETKIKDGGLVILTTHDEKFFSLGKKLELQNTSEY